MTELAATVQSGPLRRQRRGPVLAESNSSIARAHSGSGGAAFKAQAQACQWTRSFSGTGPQLDSKPASLSECPAARVNSARPRPRAAGPNSN